MKALAGLVALVLIAVAAWFLVGGENTNPTAPGADRDIKEGPTGIGKAVTGVDVGRRDVTPPQPAEPISDPNPIVEDPAAKDPPPAQGGSNPSATPPNTTVRAFDAFSGEPIPEFTLHWRSAQPQPHIATASDGAAAIYLKPGETVPVRIEAPGKVPAEHLITVSPAVPQWEESIYMDPSAPFSGMEVTATTADANPVDHLVVTAWRLADQRAEPQGPPLWSRRGDGPTGRYRLPNLERGFYYLEFRAVTEDGSPRPFQPATEKVQFMGSELLPLTVTLQAGVQLRLEVVDGRGNARGDEVRLRLRNPDDSSRQQVWIGTGPEHPATVDHLAAPGPHLLRDALAPGQYSLDAWLDGQEPVVTVVQAWNPGVQDVRVVVR